ncbi:MAG: hypothetical protein HYX59_03210 [Elusimicrobia bacterium]|nr:hypothetical protein [Elusimicrobiota bacterium]
MIMKGRIPKFRKEAEERAFWASHDSAGRVEWKKGKKVLFPNLRPALKTTRRRS